MGISRHLASALLFLGTVLSASAQVPQSVTIEGGVQETGVKSVRIDTRSFSPQIAVYDRSMKEREPENPIRFDRRKGGSLNSMPVGGLTSANRVAKDSLFPGMGATGWLPADCDMAVGPTHIVQVVNSSIAFFQKNGTKDFEQVSTTFFAGTGATSFQFDPKVIYDRIKNRFVVIFLEQSDSPQLSKILFAVSDDNNPNGSWYLYRLEAKDGTFWLDYPGFGYNKDAYVICGNMFGFAGGFNGVRFLVVPATPVQTGSAVTVSYVADTSGGSAQVAEMISPTEDKIYAMSDWNTSTFRGYALQNLTTTPTLTFANFTVPTFAYPSGDAASTNSRTLDSLDGRLFSIMWRNGKLVTSHNVSVSSRVASRWYEINTNGYPTSAMTVAQSGNIATAEHMHMPAIATNGAGDIALAFTRSSSAIAADVMSAARVSTDAAGTLGTPVLIENSTGNNYSYNRWGDYFGVDVDPTDDSLFWANAMNIISPNNWSTSIFSFRATTVPLLTSAVVSPAFVRGGSSVKLVGTISYAALSNMPVAIGVSGPGAGLVSVAPSATILTGKTSITLPVTTSRVARPTPVTFTITVGAVSKTVTLTLRP